MKLVTNSSDTLGMDNIDFDMESMHRFTEETDDQDANETETEAEADTKN